MFNRMIAAAAAVGLALAGAAVAQNFNRNPTFGTMNLRAGFEPDPRFAEVTAGGRISADRLGANCTGTIADAPDLRVNYTAGNFPLYIFAQSRADTTLVVNLPDGTWICNDDFDGLNPGIVMNRPQSGQYDIWVGVFDGGSGIPARVGISELPPRR
jgi:serine protease Do/protease YdgD